MYITIYIFIYILLGAANDSSPCVEQGIATLSDINGIDTHALDRTVLDEGDRRIYFHVTYSGKMPDKTKRPVLLRGARRKPRGPERVVTMVTELRRGSAHHYHYYTAAATITT